MKLDQPNTCGEATMRLLEAYRVSTVFGMPGVHTLDFCRGLNDHPDKGISHIQIEAEFMGALESDRPTVIIVRE